MPKFFLLAPPPRDKAGTHEKLLATSIKGKGRGNFPGNAIAMSGWDHLEDFLRYLRVERQLSPHTLRNYRLDLTQFLEFCAGHREGLSLDSGHLPGPPALSGRGSERKIARPRWPASSPPCGQSFFKYLQRQGVTSQNPAKLAPAPKLEKVLPHYLSVDEAFHLLGEPKGEDFGTRRDLAILEVFYGGGLRLSELAGLNCKDVDLASGVLRVWGKGARNAWPFWASRLRRRCRPICPCASSSLAEKH